MNAESNFPLISGRISIDLVNTEVVRHGNRHDLLTSSEHVIAWFETLNNHNILFIEQFHTNVEKWAKEALPLLQEVRSFLREGYEKMADGEKLSTDWTAYLESLIAKAPFAYKLIKGELLPIPKGKPADALVSLIALDAIDLFASNDLNNIHRCANPECVLLFIDTRGRRKWCSMKICGNRKKVTRHQQRKKKEK
ncbi:CGNR zinc finger domain-containing protein [Bacillus taeanensis]|uniref:RNA-binding protein n=1 Tax=Bacillus taeanensis TaxID=273032 RepID=A0A366XT15_9BACI|nr:CGNR zinc finger domain-containing protein [Bacillus taeanensis]RBW67303.1 RNA-binding protein [Bacillus taeanensis]